MKVTTISAMYERKVNMGDFNSANIGMTLWAQLEDGEDEAACATALREMARNHVVTELARIDRRLEAKVQDLFMGLPVDVRSKLEPVNNHQVTTALLRSISELEHLTEDEIINKLGLSRDEVAALKEI